MVARTLFLSLALGIVAVSRAVAPAPLRTVIFGGGPEPHYNQVAIESNVRYVASLLPTSAQQTILFADGKADTQIVQYESETDDAAKIVRMLFGDGPNGGKGLPFLKYRPSMVPRRDGPTTQPIVSGLFDKLATESEEAPLLLYFTGHGSPGRMSYDNNQYDLWGGGALTTTRLAAQLKKLPEKRPVTLVMVQCFSGSFGNLLFDGGVPDGALTSRPFCGFFATVPQREAAGCTPEVNEADYHDFTSYFFAALTGKNRLGKSVPLPDYNKDGVVGMDEAFAWTLINEESIDIPVATSDVFLRRFVPLKNDEEITEIPYETILMQASPAQRAALDGICAKLGGEALAPDRLATALKRLRRSGVDPQNNAIPLSNKQAQRYNALHDRYAVRYPALTDPKAETSAFVKAVSDASRALLENQGELEKARELLTEFKAAEKKLYAKEIAAARWVRLIRLAKSVVLEQKLRASNDTESIAQFDRLKAREATNPLNISER